MRLPAYHISGGALAAVFAFAACGPSDAGGVDAALDLEEPLSITIEPADQVLVIEGSTPATSDYAAIGHFEGGETRDITSEVVFSLQEPGLGSFSGESFTSGTERGGRTRVVAVLGGVAGETGLTLRLQKRHGDPASSGLPPDPEGLFEGPDDPARDPALIYPNDGVLVPPNLRLLEFHFLPGEGTTLFEISFENEVTDVKVYAGCSFPLGEGCVYTPDATVWGWLASSNRGGDELSVQVRATDDAGSGVGASQAQRLAFTFEELLGGIYYWKSAGGSDGESAIMRYDFGSEGQMVAERFAGPDMAGGNCVGCHALSRDGSKLVAAAGGWDVEDILLLDAGDGSPLGSPDKSAFESWNPDGSMYVGVFGFEGTQSYDLLLFDGQSGAFLDTIEVGASAERAATHPDWSPDGSRIAYVESGLPYEHGTNNQRFYRGAIRMVEDLGGGAWSAPIDIVPAASGRNRYYPAFSPDGGLLVFNESLCPSGAAHQDCNADSDPTAAMYVVEPEQGAAPIPLARANAPGATDEGTALTNSWPRWAPFEFQRTADPESRLFWITFSSTRNYGLRSPPAGSSEESVSGSLLWMAAIDPERALAGEDPSYAAFVLPFQDITTSNHIAQWTEEIVAVD